MVTSYRNFAISKELDTFSTTLRCIRFCTAFPLSFTSRKKSIENKEFPPPTADFYHQINQAPSAAQPLSKEGRNT